MTINFFRDRPYNLINENLIQAARNNDYLYLVHHIYAQDQKHPDEHFDEKMANRASLQLLMVKLVSLPPATLVDVGAGNANLLSDVAKLGHKVIGVDISPVRVIKNRRKQGQSLDIRFGLAEDLPIKSHSVDVIVSTETLEHVFDLDRTLDEFVRVLNPQGMRKIFVQVPLLDFADGDNHMRHFTPESLQACLRAKKFSIDECAIIPYLVGENPNNIFITATLN